MLGPLGKVSAWKYIKKFVYWSLFEYWVVRNAAFAVFTSEEEARLARQFFPFFRWKQAVVGNGAPPPTTVGPEPIARLLTRFPRLAGKDVLLYLGRLHPGKGCDILLRAFAAELTDSPQYHIVFAGPDTEASYGTALRRLATTLSIAERVTWTGMLTGEAKEAMFAIASVFVCPSHHENFGIAVVEAIARRIPAIVTNKVNIHGALASGGAAIVCDDTVDGLRGALREWIAMSGSENASMRERQGVLYERMFRPERSAETLDGVLQAAIAGRC
jgi:glycosyltransferase involved in cell wall biosynthesis